MVVGDYIVGTITAAPASLVFTPAATVTVLVTLVANATNYIYYSNGTLTSSAVVNSASSGAGTNSMSIKMFVNNTTFLKLIDGTQQCFCGVQVA